MGSWLVPPNGRSFVVGDYNLLLFDGMPAPLGENGGRKEWKMDGICFKRSRRIVSRSLASNLARSIAKGQEMATPFLLEGHNWTQTWLPRHPIATIWATAHPLFLLTQTKSPKKQGIPFPWTALVMAKRHPRIGPCSGRTRILVVWLPYGLSWLALSSLMLFRVSIEYE